jgi:NAD(P)-dependent dehydrogenase (short-subunit alcohol dehydrogenase family)
MTTTPQAPIQSGFGMRSSALDVIDGIDLHGKFAVVTGGYSGLGLETVRALVKAGCDVIAPVRSRERAEGPLKALLEEADAAGGNPGDVIIAEMDLSDPASIDALTSSMTDLSRPVDILICNAAIMASPLIRDVRGLELQFATNHVGHFQLARGLWPLLTAAEARVVVLSSIGHARSPIVFDDIHFERRAYDKWSAYGQAKTANSLFAVELDRRGQDFGVRAFAVHPGGIMTNLQRHLPQDEMRAMGWIDENGAINPLFKTPEQGAATSVWAATSARLDGHGGVYCEDCDIAPLWQTGMAQWSGVRPHAVSPEDAQRLWEVTVDALGEEAAF